MGHPSTTGCEPKKIEELIGLGKRNLENFMTEHGKRWNILEKAWLNMEKYGKFMNIPDREMLQYEGVRFSFPVIQVPYLTLTTI